MSKGTIQSHLGDGQYSVLLQYDRNKYNTIIAQLDSQISNYTTKVNNQQSIVDDLNAEMVILQSELNDLYGELNTLTNQIPRPYSAVTEKTKEVTTKQIETQEKQSNVLQESITLSSLKIHLTGYKVRKKYINDNFPNNKSINCWCVDKTENLTGDVGIIDIPGESIDFNIRPGFTSATYDISVDGYLLPTVIQTPSQAFYNISMMPGWQKWMPTYRYGTLTSKNGTLGNVTIDTTTSSQQDLNINQQNNLTNIPFEYMDCDSDAFSTGDKVVIQFIGQDFDNPKIIGFQNNPKNCMCDHWEVDFTELWSVNKSGNPWSHNTPSYTYDNGAYLEVEYDYSGGLYYQSYVRYLKNNYSGQTFDCSTDSYFYIALDYVFDLNGWSGELNTRIELTFDAGTSNEESSTEWLRIKRNTNDDSISTLYITWQNAYSPTSTVRIDDFSISASVGGNFIQEGTKIESNIYEAGIACCIKNGYTERTLQVWGNDYMIWDYA